MNEKNRIKKDLIMFEENFNELKNKKIMLKDKKVIDLAYQYYQDSIYYLKKKDYFTAFGCVNYSHGLIDAVLKF